MSEWSPGRVTAPAPSGGSPPAAPRARIWWLLAVNALAEVIMWTAGYAGYVRFAGELGEVGPQPSAGLVDGLQAAAVIAFLVVVVTALVSTGVVIVRWRAVSVGQKVCTAMALALALLIVGLLAYWIYDFVTTPWNF